MGRVRPTTDGPDFARTTDLHETELRLQKQIEQTRLQLHKEIEQTRLELHKEIEETRLRLGKEIDQVRSETAQVPLEVQRVRAQVGAVDTRLQQAMHRQTLWIVGAVGTVVGLIRLLDYLLA
jgi:chromosome segregation ATPase